MKNSYTSDKEKGTNKLLRVDKFLSDSSKYTRKEIRSLIKAGRIKVNDDIVNKPGTLINANLDKVTLDDNVVEYKEFYYIMLNKPKGVITATVDGKHRTVLDLINENYKKFKLSPVGRLDIDTEGLLILTNDGLLLHNLISPSKDVYKTYYAELEKNISAEDIDKFETGIILDDGYVTLPAKLEPISQDKLNKVYVQIKEGKFHQVKRMFKAVGNKVVYLKRVKMGNLALDESLLPGQYRELKNEEVEILRQS